MVYLYWRWPGTRTGEAGQLITERCAPYEDLVAARAQADHDLALCEVSDDYSAAPVRIVDEGGAELWAAPIPDGR